MEDFNLREEILLRNPEIKLSIGDLAEDGDQMFLVERTNIKIWRTSERLYGLYAERRKTYSSRSLEDFIAVLKELLVEYE
jgi:hypothetical protein